MAEFRFSVPQAYFAANRMDGRRLEVYEYNDGVLVATLAVAADPGSPDADGLMHYTLMVDKFSTFAAVGAARSGGGGGGGGGGSACPEVTVLVDSARLAGDGSTAFASFADWNGQCSAVRRIDITREAADTKPVTFRARAAKADELAAAPPAAGYGPAAVAVHIALEDAGPLVDGKVVLAVPAAAFAAGAEAPLTLHAWNGTAWNEVAHTVLSRDAGFLYAEFHATAFGLFAVSPDVAPPTVALQAESSGLHARIAASDNRAVAAVSVLVDGVHVPTPPDGLVSVAGLAPGEHAVKVTAVDRSGLSATATLTLVVEAAPVPQPGPEPQGGQPGPAPVREPAGRPGSAALAWLATAGITGALLVFLLLRRRRKDDGDA